MVRGRPRTFRRRLMIAGLGSRVRPPGATKEPSSREQAPVRSAGNGESGVEPGAWHRRRIFRVVHEAWREFEQDYARYFAVAMIYYALLALVPSLLLLMAGLGFLLRFSPAAATAQQEALQAIERNFGPDLASTVQHLLHGLEQQSNVALILSLFGLILTASVLVHHLRMSFRAIWHYPAILAEPQPRRMVVRAVAEKTISFGVVVAGAAFLLLTLPLIASVNWLLKRISSDWLFVIPSSLVIAPLTFALLFRFLPPQRVPWRHVWMGALLCGVVWDATGSVLMVVNNLFGRGSSAYGAVGTLLAAMLWISIVSKSLFFGAELCKVLAKGDSGRVRVDP